MTIQNRLAVTLLSFLASTALVGSATADCTGSTCSLGGQNRFQIGSSLPIPVSLNFATTLTPGRLTTMGSHTTTTMGGVGNPVTSNALLKKFDYYATSMGGFGMPGINKATVSATIMQQSPAPAGTPSTAPRSLMMAPGQLHFNEDIFSIGLMAAQTTVLAVQTDFTFDWPHPNWGSVTYAAGGRTGPPTVTWCAGLPKPGSINPACATPSSFGFTTTTTGPSPTNMSVTKPRSNGIIRFTATKNQFGGPGGGRTLGTAMVFFNQGLPVGSLPCSYATGVAPNGAPGPNDNCVFAHSIVVPDTGGGSMAGEFGQIATNPAFTTPTGVFTGDLGVNGTILRFGSPELIGGNPQPFTGQANTSWDIPRTTGRLTVSVTKNAAALSKNKPEVFIREGTDMRTAGGQGIVVLVSGALSKRNISGPNGNRGWQTLNVPEPASIVAASAGLLALFGCHQLVRRRRR